MCSSDHTPPQVELFKVRFEVNVQPVAAGLFGISRRGLDEPATDPPMLPAWVHGRIQQERVSTAVPAHLDKAHHLPGVESAHPP